MDLMEASEDIIAQYDIKINESRPWNFKSGEATFAEAALSERIFAKQKWLIVREVELTFAWSNHHMDLLEAAKDATKQFDIKKVAKNLQSSEFRCRLKSRPPRD